MEASFVFNINHPADPKLEDQLSRALEKYVELEGREQHPHIWAVTDRLNTRKGSPQRRSMARMRASLMLILWFTSLGLVIPSILTPGAMLLPLAAGAIFWVYASIILYHSQPKLTGIVSLVVSLLLFLMGFVSAELRSQVIPALCCLTLGLFCIAPRHLEKMNSFSSAAQKLLAQRRELAEQGSIRVEFGKSGMSLQGPDGAPVPSVWSRFTRVIETTDLFIAFYSDKVLFLEKKDLFGSLVRFEDMLKEHTRLISLE